MNQATPLDRKSLLLTVLLIILLVLLAGSLATWVFSDPNLEQSLTLMRAAHVINAFYPVQVDWDDLASAARREMFDRLDRYSNWV
ncbi:MAG: hypothetical protein OEW00_12545, partial [candidate division Zixibacteria bacterium]|nr:hypothetical protein [candidate division Zixibacteria bacterium]